MALESEAKEHYFIDDEEIAYEPNRNKELHQQFGSDAQFVHVHMNKEEYHMVLHLRSSNAQHYTPLGFIELIEQAKMTEEITNFILSHFSWIKIVKQQDYAMAAKVQFSVSMSNVQTAAKLIHEVRVNLFQNPRIRLIIGDKKDNRCHWTKAKYANFPNKYVIKGIALSLKVIDIKNIKNSTAVTEILLNQVPGLERNQFRWKRTWSDNSTRFIDSIILESKTEITTLKHERKFSFPLKIKNRVTGIIVHIERINQRNKLEVSQKINNEPIKTIFNKFLEDQDDDQIMRQHQITADANAVASIKSFPDQNQASGLGQQ